MVARKHGRVRYPNGALVPLGTTRAERICDEDLAAGRYPPGDIRNRPEVRAALAAARPVDLEPFRGCKPWERDRMP